MIDIVGDKCRVYKYEGGEVEVEINGYGGDGGGGGGLGSFEREFFGMFVEEE